jgi:hypothetical protein
MRDRRERGRRGERPPRRPSFLRKLIVAMLAVALLGGGYLGWRYRQKTGEIDLDKEKWRTLVSDEVDGAKAGYKKVKNVIKDASIKTVARSRELLGSVETWLKERKVEPATREELKETGERYARDFGRGSRTPSRDASPPEAAGTPEAPPASAPSPPPASREATGEAAKSLARGREEFSAGYEHWLAAGKAGPEQEELALARERFASAQEHLNRAQEGAPDDESIEELLVETNRFLYDCLKRIKVDEKN